MREAVAGEAPAAALAAAPAAPVEGAAVLAAAPRAGVPVVLTHLARVTPHLKERMGIM